jgi:hypothetical protein
MTETVAPTASGVDMLATKGADNLVERMGFNPLFSTTIPPAPKVVPVIGARRQGGGCSAHARMPLARDR